MAPDDTSLTVRARFVSLRQGLARVPLSVFQLGLRIGVGMVFFRAGLLKWNSWDFTILLFRDEYQVPLLAPDVAARLVMFNELIVPALLIAGLATRLATLPLLGMITVIQLFVYPNAWAEHVFWGTALIFLLTRGPGTFSIDHLVEQYLQKSVVAGR